jgi:hypothetical protein
MKLSLLPKLVEQGAEIRNPTWWSEDLAFELSLNCPEDEK